MWRLRTIASTLLAALPIFTGLTNPVYAVDFTATITGVGVEQYTILETYSIPSGFATVPYDDDNTTTTIGTGSQYGFFPWSDPSTALTIKITINSTPSGINTQGTLTIFRQDFGGEENIGSVSCQTDKPSGCQASSSVTLEQFNSYRWRLEISGREGQVAHADLSYQKEAIRYAIQSATCSLFDSLALSEPPKNIGRCSVNILPTHGGNITSLEFRAASNHPNIRVVFADTGTSNTSSEESDLIASVSIPPLKAVSANLNSDALSDVVENALIDEKLAVRTHLSDGAGGFTTSGWYETGDRYREGSRFADTVVADYNGDGHDDIIHIRTDWERLIFRVHISDGAGGFTSLPWYNTGDQFCADTCFIKVLVADVNGDGRQDLVHVRTDSQKLLWKVHLANTGNFSPQPWYRTGDQYCADACFVQVLVADVNGDGRQDLVHVRTDSQKLLWKVHLANGASGFSPQPWYRTSDQYAEDSARFGTLAAHLDSNNLSDVVHWRTDGGRIIVRNYLADPSSSFASNPWYRTGDFFGENTRFYGLLSADLDGDGHTDILHWCTDSGNLILKVHFSDGVGGYQSGSWYHTP